LGLLGKLLSAEEVSYWFGDHTVRENCFEKKYQNKSFLGSTEVNEGMKGDL